ncbi:hypothetical protein GDI02_02540 [Listeria monocytogenes]|nr:hypothetical protein [Listeria monocytogenes]EDH3848496.1 hypothetical protein [Listeria monocytogenes]EDO0402152.1 hypothetical protein [Listeria monocytogenes]
MTIQPGDKVEVQDRTGVTDLCVDGEQYYVLINNNGLLTLEDTDGFSSFNISANQVKKMKVDSNSQIIDELYEQSKHAHFYLYDTEFANAINFVSAVGEPTYSEVGNTKWFSAENGKITATAFLKEED